MTALMLTRSEFIPITPADHVAIAHCLWSRSPGSASKVLTRYGGKRLDFDQKFEVVVAAQGCTKPATTINADEIVRQLKLTQPHKVVR